jgi:hypothetical protein
MSSLSSLRCFNHGTREAVARCPECERFYCRECISDYDGIAICASCLGAKATPEEKVPRNFDVLFDVSRIVIGLMFCWLLLYVTGTLLQMFPTTDERVIREEQRRW